ncbi:AAA family ATPase [uncultured Treponema sp.]|uniref:ATP-dependent nuclease n=1 Tax=uncultured Treponema sp. TaxID=162155 RepID=UPI0025D05A01|nr:AAA family ATPase [uncultured Treponema sp.]
METIKLSNIRIAGFRGLKDISISLDNTTLLTGCNNVGKTSVLKALQLALGNTSFLTQEDFYVDDSGVTEQIIIDILFISVDENGNKLSFFSQDWESIFTESCIQYDSDGYPFVGLRTMFSYDASISNFSRKHRILKRWNPEIGEIWQEIDTTDSKFKRDSIPFFYIEAQRDIVEDTKSRMSFIGKLLSEVYKSYTPEKIQEIEEKIKQLNETTINNSSVLSNVQKTLKEIESAIDNDNSEVSITPFTKKLRDLNKGITIHYGNNISSYTMDYHGMGTRSWSSLLTFKSFILQHKEIANTKSIPFYPIITIEEPEAHLHPDAQKRLYQQISEIPGQKIISTHSSYIASTAQLNELRNMYKSSGEVLCGALFLEKLEKSDIRILRQKVINTKGEIIFAKALIFFEGETEEQALPVFAEKYFSSNPVSLGLEFIGVGGCGNCYPFVYLAKQFNIPWYIFSDGEQKTKKNVLKTCRKLYSNNLLELSDIPNVFIIDSEADFEQMLINDGYHNEIETSLNELFDDSDCVQKYINQKQGTSAGRIKTEKICDKCHQNIYVDDIRDYTTSDGYERALNDIMSDNKTAFAPIIADTIVNSSKGLPPLVMKLFDKIKEDFHICQE